MSVGPSVHGRPSDRLLTSAKRHPKGLVIDEHVNYN